jgi:hypothetical protein
MEGVFVNTEKKDSIDSIKDSLWEAVKNGWFLETVYNIFMDGEYKNEKLFNDIATLHNEGKIDAVAEFNKLSNPMVAGDFFMTRHVFEEILPALDASPEDVMNCIKHLIKEAGNDMAANTPNNAFAKYCEADRNRPQEILNIAKQANENLTEFIAPAITTGAKININAFLIQAIELLQDKNIEVIINSSWAIGWINYDNNLCLTEKAFSALEELITKKYNDQLWGSVLNSAFYIYFQDKSLKNRLARLTSEILKHQGEFTFFRVSCLFWQEQEKIHPELLRILLIFLKNTKPEFIVIIRNIDYGLQKLLAKSAHEDVILFLEEIIVKNSGNLSILAFESISRKLYQTYKKLLNKITTRWFLSQEPLLWNALLEIINQGNTKDILLSVDLSELKNKDEIYYLFIARKVIGWFFMHPLSATSFIVSLLEYAPEEKQNEIADLLFWPLLVNYPVKVKEYLTMILPDCSGKIQSFINESVAKIESYFENIRSVPEIQELSPSTTQKQIYQEYINTLTGEAYEKAKKDHGFIVDLIAHKIILLYGNKWIMYIDRNDGSKPERSVSTLQKHEMNFVPPRSEYIDPFGFDYIFRVFRVERIVEL